MVDSPTIARIEAQLATVREKIANATGERMRDRYLREEEELSALLATCKKTIAWLRFRNGAQVVNYGVFMGYSFRRNKRTTGELANNARSRWSTELREMIRQLEEIGLIVCLRQFPSLADCSYTIWDAAQKDKIPQIDPKFGENSLERSKSAYNWQQRKSGRKLKDPKPLPKGATPTKIAHWRTIAGILEDENDWITKIEVMSRLDRIDGIRLTAPTIAEILNHAAWLGMTERSMIGMREAVRLIKPEEKQFQPGDRVAYLPFSQSEEFAIVVRVDGAKVYCNSDRGMFLASADTLSIRFVEAQKQAG